MNKYLILISGLFLIALYSCNQAASSDNSDNSNNHNTTQNDSTIVNIDTVIHLEIAKENLLGKTNPVNDSMFVEVPQKYCLMRKEYVHKDVLEPYIAMYDAAAKENINLGIISAFRSFETQKWLWNQRYYNSSNPEAVAKSVLSYLAMPGTSRHHWGTDIDMLNTKLNFFTTEEGQKAYQWMCENAPKFGFYQVYTNNRTSGYNEEKWHWSYLPISKEFQYQYRQKISYDDLNGFNGSEVAFSLNVIDDYVFGIDSLLLVK